ncbi:hypothetical protein V6N11_033238 [Hibiscus sabdariffa]|uniref:Uncharacterized protein n=1 Tax=Hibiscus sabdariffa TaxID=183260 RepID=A0ABR2PXK4_9ROSI
MLDSIEETVGLSAQVCYAYGSCSPLPLIMGLVPYRPSKHRSHVWCQPGPSLGRRNGLDQSPGSELDYPVRFEPKRVSPEGPRMSGDEARTVAHL